MGNTTNQSFSTKGSETSKYVYKTLGLESQRSTSTESCLHAIFVKQFINANKKGFEKAWNPLCPMHMKISQNWMTCCFISPIMALVSPLYLFDNNEQFNFECEVMAYNGKQMEALKVVDAIMIKEEQLCLLVLEKPFLKVGWMGISYVESLGQLKQNRLKIVNHPQKVYQQSVVHIQRVKEIQSLKKSHNSAQDLTIKNKDLIGSIIIKIQSGIPSIIGIQISEFQALLFDRKLFKTLRTKVKIYIDTNRKEIIQQINEKLFLEHQLIKGSILCK